MIIFYYTKGVTKRMKKNDPKKDRFKFSALELVAR